MSPMKRLTMNNRGFTLIELIISIAIIAILLIAGASILSTTLVIIVDEGNDTEALYQAQDAMERLVSGEVTIINDTIVYNKLELPIQADGHDEYIDGIPGRYYKILEKGSTNVILKAFVPN